jgi:hypothetical protein
LLATVRHRTERQLLAFRQILEITLLVKSVIRGEYTLADGTLDELEKVIAVDADDQLAQLRT